MSSIALALPLSAIVLLLLIRRDAWPRFAVEAFPGPARRGIAIGLLIAVLGLVSFAPLIAFDPSQARDDFGEVRFATLFLGHALLAAFLLVWWLLVGRPPLSQYLALRREPGRFLADLRLGAAGGALAWAVTMTVMVLVGTAVGSVDSAALPPSGQDQIPHVVRWIVDLSVGERLALICSAAVVEESFFRSFLQSRCGILISSLLFAASHATYGLTLMLVGVFTVSLVLGWMFRARANVLPCMVAHGVFDAVQLFVILPAVVGRMA